MDVTYNLILEKLVSYRHDPGVPRIAALIPALQGLLGA